MEKISAVEDFLTCPVCLETFKEPVSLGCHHSFCSVCLHNYWDQNSTRTCPVCRRKSSKEHLDVNFALKELTLSFTQKEQAPGGERPVVCSSHPEQTPLFCLDERRPLCPVCEFSLHSGHKVVSVDSAVSEVKEQLRSTAAVSVPEERAGLTRTHTQCEQIQELAHAQVELCERHIRAEFERLHRFLQQEEESVLRALRQEQSRQAQAIEAQLQQIREELCTMEQNLQTVEDLLQRQSVDFLTQYRHTHKDTQTLLSQHSPQLGPGLLINQAKVLANVAFNAWNKMRALVSYSPVTLDTNTAGRRIHLSEDLRGVRNGDKQQVPENPERFCQYDEVLGSEGFSSGSHQWDVEVGDHPYWAIGLAKESVDRKGERYATPENGLWCLGLNDGEYFGFSKTLSLKRRPQRIRVRLDCDEGKVFFFDAGDMSLICSHKHRFTEKMFPYFAVGESGDAKTKEIKIFSTEDH
ncbi:hypothetical protein NL108_012661 [Boleophthalmus pectinirostris]|uniref:zinc-binding protein A33-like n=1 Tax=Boleophthalmus pectinirostris TaxID=150288 RepID=UPI00242EB31C|nr:zinc-binding protein A33-like [Boleophthalmus pectinirostris]KAJ0065499.1 hypothetical protein NL108_012661 [Boleophthalmus pectinirostris]